MLIYALIGAFGLLFLPMLFGINIARLMQAKTEAAATSAERKTQTD